MSKKMERRKGVISVIVPVYNSERYLDECISSILSQTYHSLEVILVDDGSTDCSYEICSKWKEKDSRVNLLKQQNLGVSAARNKGILHSSGEYIAFVDSDDCIRKNMYEIMMNYAIKEKVSMVIGNWVIYDIASKQERLPNYKMFGRMEASKLKKNIFSENENYGGGYPWNRLINYEEVCRKANRKLLFCKELFVYEDKYWIMQLCDYMGDVYLIPEVLYDYKLRGNSLSHDFSREKVYNELLAWRYMLNLFDGLEETELKEIRGTYTQACVRNTWTLRNEGNAFLIKLWSEIRTFKCRKKLNWKDWIKFILIDSVYMRR